MEEGKKQSFGQLVQSTSWQQLQQMDYIKVKVVYHQQDKTKRQITYPLALLRYKCSAKENLLRFAIALRLSFKLKEHETVFLYLDKKLVDHSTPRLT